jgi:hypothetical protein
MNDGTIMRISAADDRDGNYGNGKNNSNNNDAMTL